MNFNFTLGSAQWWSIAKGAAMAAAGAILAYATQAASGADFGAYGPLVAAALAVLSNYLHKTVTTPSETPTK